MKNENIDLYKLIWSSKTAGKDGEGKPVDLKTAAAEINGLKSQWPDAEYTLEHVKIR